MRKRKNSGTAMPALRHCSALGAFQLLCACVMLLLAHCGKSLTTIPAGLAQRYTGAGYISPTAQSIRESFGHILAPFNDSLPAGEIESVWESHRLMLGSKIESSAQPDIANLDIMLSIVKEKGYRAYSLQGASGEALHAISGLPVLPCVLILHFPQKRFEPLKQQDLASQNFILLAPHAEHTGLHIIEHTAWGAEVCEIKTRDGLVWTIPADEPFLGQVFAAPSGSGTSGYCQAAAAFFITRLPAFEIKEHIVEWFNRLPGAPQVPQVSALN